ncbi:hypothetical protein U1Q18_016951 [Sarracenia purpurea var. burkii]
MGACVSTPEGCVGGRLSSSRKKCSRKRKKAIKRKVSSRLSDRSFDMVDKSALPDGSNSHPAFHGRSLSALFSPISVSPRRWGTILRGDAGQFKIQMTVMELD